MIVCDRISQNRKRPSRSREIKLLIAEKKVFEEINLKKKPAKYRVGEGVTVLSCWFLLERARCADTQKEKKNELHVATNDLQFRHENKWINDGEYAIECCYRVQPDYSNIAFSFGFVFAVFLDDSNVVVVWCWNQYKPLHLSLFSNKCSIGICALIII